MGEAGGATPAAGREEEGGTPRRPGGPRLFVLLGSPVEHSLSPALHRAALAAMGEDAVYAAVPTEADEVAALMQAVSRSGGGNVTLPHKGRAARAVDRRTSAVEATGACNCFWREEGRLVGDNTDVEGFLEAVAEVLPGADAVRGLQGTRVLILGAGGGARAVLHAVERAGAARVEVLNRTLSRAEEMVEAVAAGSGEVRVLAGPGEVEGAYGLVVNATSLGLDPDDPLPLELDGLETGAAFDLVYGPEGTSWSREARRRGIPVRDGREMLVRQAAASLRRWLGRAPPLPALREALEPRSEGPGSSGGRDGG